MPQYTPVNPSLVAFNPSQVSDGMMSAFNLAKALEDIKSKKALQAELDTTRKQRLAAQNAQNELIAAEAGAGLGLVEPQTALKLGEIGQKQRLLEPTTNARLSDLAFGTAKNNANIGNLGLLASVDKAKAEADLSTIGPVAQATVAEAGARKSEAETSVALADLKRASTAAQLEMAQLINKLGMANAAPEALLKAIKTSSLLASAKTDDEHRKALQQADLALKESQTAQNLAQADYALGLGRQNGGAGNTPEQEAKRLQGLIKELDNMKIGDGTRTLGVYINETFNDDGTVKGDKYWGLQSNATRDPIGDFYIQQRQAYQQKLINLRDAIGGGPRPQQPAQAPSSGLKVGDVKNGYKYLGGNPNDKASWQKQ